MKVERLGKENYDEIIGLMNAVFSRKNGREMDFERDIPKMCVRDDEHMRKHFGIFEDGKLVACLGVYPFETVVAGEKLLFSTMGNVVTHWDYEGKGYMSALLERGAQELNDLNVDVSRLGGLRSRYNRYGFESCGQKYYFTFTSKERERKFPDFKDDITFSVIEKTDKKALQVACELYNANEIAVTRTSENAYATMTAWRNVPYIAVRNGKAIGYLCANPTGTGAAEVFGMDAQAQKDILCAWQKKCGENINFSLQPHQVEAVQMFSAVCGNYYIGSPSHFYIRNWEKVVGAFMKLKASYCQLPKGELCIGIENYGTIRLFVNENGAGCKKTDETPEITLDRLAAARYIFGPFPPVCTGKASALAQAWFPLPLSWNGQDRV